MRTVKVTSKKLAKIIIVIIAFGFFVSFTSQKTTAQEKHQVAPGNFGLRAPRLANCKTLSRWRIGFHATAPQIIGAIGAFISGSAQGGFFVPLHWTWF